MTTATQTKKSTPKATSAPTSPKQFDPRPTFALWKPRKGEGAAAIFEFSSDKGCFFLRMMPESKGGTSKFNHDASITAKLGLNDIGEFLSVLVGRSEGLGKKDDKGYWTGLFHKNPAGTSAIKFNKGTNYGYFLALSTDRGGEKANYSIGVTNGECELLRVFLEHGVKNMFLSNGPSPQSSPVENTTDSSEPAEETELPF